MLCSKIIYMIAIAFAFISVSIGAPVTEFLELNAESDELVSGALSFNLTDRSILPRDTVVWHFWDTTYSFANCVPSPWESHCTGIYHQNYDYATPGSAQVFFYTHDCQLMGSNEDVSYWDMSRGVSLENWTPWVLVIYRQHFALNTDKDFMGFQYHTTQDHHPFTDPVLEYDQRYIYNKNIPDDGNRGLWHRFTVDC